MAGTSFKNYLSYIHCSCDFLPFPSSVEERCSDLHKSSSTSSTFAQIVKHVLESFFQSCCSYLPTEPQVGSQLNLCWYNRTLSCSVTCDSACPKHLRLSYGFSFALRTISEEIKLLPTLLVSESCYSLHYTALRVLDEDLPVISILYTKLSIPFVTVNLTTFPCRLPAWSKSFQLTFLHVL